MGGAFAVRAQHGTGSWSGVLAGYDRPPAYVVEMKRKSGPQRSVAKRCEGAQGSRFTPCPACGLTVPLFRLEAHLDSDCSSSTASVAQTESAPQGCVSGACGRQGARPLAHPSQQPQLQPLKVHAGNLFKEALKSPDPQSSAAAAAAARAAEGIPDARSQQDAGPGANGSAGGSRSSAAGRQWWHGQPAAVATGFKSSGQQRVALTGPALLAATQCELLPSFLPAGLADTLLLQLQADSPSYEHMQWWIGEHSSGDDGSGRERGGARAEDGPGLSSKTSCRYLLAREGTVQQQQQNEVRAKPCVPQLPVQAVRHVWQAGDGCWTVYCHRPSGSADSGSPGLIPRPLATCLCHPTAGRQFCM